MTDPTGWFDPWSPENEYIASSLYWRWCANWNIHAFPEWADVGGREKERWRERAQLALDALDLEFEFGIQYTETSGVERVAYESERLAYQDVKLMGEDDPDTDAKVIVRVVGKWEEC